MRRQSVRLSHKKKSLETFPPKPDEISQIHKYYLLRKQYNADPDKWMTINSTMQQKSLLMHSQDRNIHGNIFGGFLMREAYELGWLTAHLFANRDTVQIKHIHDFQFIQPVKIGDLISFTARVCYVQDNLIDVIVHVENISDYHEKSKTNELYLTFQSNKNVTKNVYAITYEECMLNCDSQRRLKDFL